MSVPPCRILTPPPSLQGVTPLHAAAYNEHIPIVRFLLSRGANPKMIVKAPTSGTERGLERVEPILKYHVGSSLLHWAAAKGHDDLLADLLARGLPVDADDRLGRTPLGLATWAGHTTIVNTLLQENSALSEEDKDWRGISREEVGLCIVRVIEETAVCSLNATRADGFTLLHLAAQRGYPNMMHRLLSLKVSPDVRNNQGETPLFVAIRNNQLACVQQLINAGTRLSLVDNRGGSALHMAAKNGNVTVIDMLLTTSELEEERNVDINRCDKIGYTPIYYAINASRYDIVQRFLEYSLVRKVHCKATNGETLLQFYTERNNLGQYDNAVVRVLECEKLLHATKPSAEMCLRVQLEYHQDYLKSVNDSAVVARNVTTVVNGSFVEELVMEDEENDEGFLARLTDNPDKINFLLTVFFILLPITLLSTWNLYIHVTQQDILPIFKLLPSFLRVTLYTLIFLTPLAPVMAYLENTYAQMKHMNVTARQMQEVGVKDVTLGSILSLSPLGQNTQLSKQVFSVLISLVSLTWSFTSYHRFSKLGGLTILNALPLLFAIFFQVVSRAIACTVFTLAYTWKVFIVLGVHFMVVLVFKLKLEESSVLPVRTPFYCCTCFFMYLRPYFYVFLGTIASTLVYFRLERPSAVKKQRSRRHSTVVIQVLFLVLAFIENLVLLALGVCGLDKDKYDTTFIIISAVLCAISYLTGVILHAVYYSCFGHPWVDINGPSVHRDSDEGTLVLSYYQQGRVSKWAN
ncbi:Ankyrin-1 [Chionoecetes opilio]|uniref:XK-related protein n=1 Tax=Chionoecetes opilio TaxID=41210 RepID=A0A8J4YF71_CHIOP|nr:Ankyrin-1 [Chionoecetes opilio]